MNLREFCAYYLPLLVTAGDYALQIQNRIEGHNKAGDNAFSQALTDADLSVQNFIEIATLARFPEIAFFGEEQQQSLNAKYFRQEAPYKLFLDPINGTRFYQDKLPLFDIILSLTYHGEYVAGISYIPATQTFFLGFKDEGAFVISREEVLRGEAYRPLRILPGAGTLIVLNSPKLKNVLAPDYETFDIVNEYDPARCKIAVHSVLSGNIGGFLGYGCSYLDTGVIAFIAAQAGAYVTDLQGHPPQAAFSRVDTTDRIPDLIVTRDPVIHDQLLKRIAEFSKNSRTE